ncbi:VOC family protein [Paenibacillus lactis]|uniref:PhnB protein n=1 Tax=Paenibacillus lactis TaxID=228574 RepID=A0ABS4FJU3_9BACL|nr:VOC family protein [Paenibacillus lactis]MBP1896493.1 PhnB protein [Paenibacillus lactis]HAG00686.1 VOC family protein [Paenibacillus lactis]
MIKLNVYLKFNGQAEEAMFFYKDALKVDLAGPIVRYQDMSHKELPDEDKNLILNMGLDLGESILMASDTREPMHWDLIPNVTISLNPKSREEADRLFAALSEGGTIIYPIADQPWGDYFGHLRDKFGVAWDVMVND